MSKDCANIVGYHGASLQVVFSYQDESGDPFDITEYTAKINIYDLNSDNPVDSRSLTHSDTGELSVFYSVSRIKGLPEVGRYEVMFTSISDPDIVFPVHINSFTVSSVQKSGTIQSGGTFTLESQDEKIVAIKSELLDSVTFALKTRQDIESLSQEFGILPNFISKTIGQLPGSTGAAPDISKGLYVGDDGLGRIVEWDGTQYNDILIPILTTDAAKIDSVALLRQRPGSVDGQVMELLGHSEEGVGAGPVYWDAGSTETDNDGTIFQVTGVATGRWKRPISKRVHLSDWGVTGSGDETAKLVSALAVAESKGKALSLDGLDINVVGEISAPSVTIYGDGGTITSDGSAFTIRAQGSWGSYYSNDLLAKKGDSWMVNASLAAEVSKGDLVQIQSDEKVAPNIPVGEQGHTTTWGEMHLVEEVDGDTIHFEAPLFRTYKSLNESATDTRARRITPTLFNIYDTKIKQPFIDGASGVIVQFGYKNDVQVSATDCKGVSFRIDNSYRVSVDSRSSASPQDGSGYGISVSGCSTFTTVKGTYLNCRHAFATTASGTDGAGWGTLVEGVIGSASSVEYNHSIFDTHTACGSIHFKNCIGLGANDKTLTAITEWDDAFSYSIGADVYADDGYYYRSKADSNLNNDPITDDGTNWLAGANSTGALFGFRGGDVEITNCAGYRLQTGVSLSTNRLFGKVHVNGLYMNDMCRKGIVLDDGSEVGSLMLNNISVTNNVRWDHSGAILDFSDDCTINKLVVGDITGENISLLRVNGIISGIDEIIMNSVDVSNLETLKACAQILDTSIQRLIINNLNVSGFSGIVVSTVAMERIEVNNFHVKDTGSVLVNSAGDVDVIALNGGSYERRAGGSNQAMVLLNGTTYNVVRLTNIDVPASADVTGAIENNGTITKFYRMGNQWNGNALYASGSNLADLEILSGDGETGGVLRGTGSPEGVVTADGGVIYQDRGGGIYVQDSAGGNTGWVAK